MLDIVNKFKIFLLMFLSLFFSIVVASTSKSEPGPTISWLMKNSVSMFSFGMYRLDLDIKSISSFPVFIQFRGARYDWKQNRVLVFAHSNERFSKEHCKEVLNRLRANGGVSDGKLFQFLDLTNSFYADYFSPIGYDFVNKPENFLNKIDEVINIHVSMGDDGCEGGLISKEILYRETDS